jgi:glycosyltransferase involved in cell wall biosynthesis
MTINFTVTNDLNYDQRMHRICGSLQAQGHNVVLIGRQRPNSIPLQAKSYRQHRIKCFFHKGVLFYLEYNLRLIVYLVRAKSDVICSIDLDTLAAGVLASRWSKQKLVFDAHEYFPEVPELKERAFKRGIWLQLERFLLPKIRHAYTVTQGIAELYESLYPGLEMKVIRNFPLRTVHVPIALPEIARLHRPFVLYQGDLNEGRGIIPCLEAMSLLHDFDFVIVGDGYERLQIEQTIITLGLSERVHLLGHRLPDELRRITPFAWLGINILQNKGLNYYHSLANKFSDYIQAGIPQISMDFPEYRRHNEPEIAVLVKSDSVSEIHQALERLLNDNEYYKRLKANAIQQAQVYTWENEAKKLIEFYDAL